MPGVMAHDHGKHLNAHWKKTHTKHKQIFEDLKLVMPPTHYYMHVRTSVIWSENLTQTDTNKDRYRRKTPNKNERSANPVCCTKLYPVLGEDSRLIMKLKRRTCPTIGFTSSSNVIFVARHRHHHQPRQHSAVVDVFMVLINIEMNDACDELDTLCHSKQPSLFFFPIFFLNPPHLCN